MSCRGKKLYISEKESGSSCLAFSKSKLNSWYFSKPNSAFIMSNTTCGPSTAAGETPLLLLYGMSSHSAWGMAARVFNSANTLSGSTPRANDFLALAQASPFRKVDLSPAKALCIPSKYLFSISFFSGVNQLCSAKLSPLRL